MTKPRFIQIHTLHSYSAALLNRDDTGLAKRLPYGGVTRTRISSQCLKRHWRMADDPHNVHNIEGAEESVRSREIVSKEVIEPLGLPEDMRKIIEPVFQKAVYGEKGETQKGRQPLLLGRPEIGWLRDQARNLASQAAGDVARAKELCKEWTREYGKNTRAMRENTRLPGGLAAALFGRMVTSDPEANIDAPIHVAHAFTVHEAEEESDYFSVVDDLKSADEDAGAAHIGETDLNSGLFYGYVVIDVPGLVSNLTGMDAKDWQQADRTMAAKVVHNLLHLIAEVSPGAKLGSTAPYGYAELMLVEAGERQPRSLSGAFRKPCPPRTDEAIEYLSSHLQRLDDAYATGEARRFMSIGDGELPGAQRLSLPELAGWISQAIKNGEAA